MTDTTTEPCPVCAAAHTALLAAYEGCVTSDSRILERHIENRYCAACGAVFNPAGRRGELQRFYAEEYDLLADSSDAEFMYADDRNEAAIRGVNDQMLDFIAEAGALPVRGSMLEVGCGKGVFLRKFAARHGGWSLAAVEPGAGARGRMAGLPNGTEFHPGTFETSPFLGRTFDFVASVGVLEHVTDPRAFASAIVACLKPGATCFISVPDFTLNPADLLTFDHLTRFTAVTARRVLEEAGLTVTHQIAGQRVPMWLMGRRDAAAVAAPSPLAPPAASAAVTWLSGSLNVYGELARDVVTRGGRVGVYGTGLAVFGAVAQGRIDQDCIDCFIDDNPHLQGSERLGKPVVSLEQAAARGITDLTFSASPAYLPRMEAKARAALPGGVKLWPLPHNG